MSKLLAKLAPYRKAALPATIAIIGELIALGVLRGKALIIATTVNAGLTAIAGGVFAIPNAPKPPSPGGG